MDQRESQPDADTVAEDAAPPESGGDVATRAAVAWRWGRIVLQLGLPILIVWIVWREVHALDLTRVRAHLTSADATLVALGIGAAFLAVVVMGLYDAVAFPRGAAGMLTFRRRWVLGSVLFGWTNFVSMGPVGGPALRLLAYRRFGLTGPEITRGFVGHAMGSSAGLMGWMLAVWAPGSLGWSGFAWRAPVALVSSMVLAEVFGRVMVALVRRNRFGSDLVGIRLKTLGAVSFFDWGLTLASFLLLVRSVGVVIDPSGAARTVFTGQFAGLVSMIPGGLGSADAVWYKGFALLGVSQDSAAAAVVIFRAGFYLVPWAATLVVLYIVLCRQSERMRVWQRRLVAGAVALNACLLLLSAATPAVRDRLHAVAKALPLGAIEVSHIMATASAALMLFLVRGLLRGYRGAYLGTMALLAASALAHPIKGGDVEEGLASIVLMAMLFGVRGAFTRRGRIPIGWELTLSAAVGSVAFFLVVGFAAFEKIPYRHEMWLTFSARAEASRFLRGAIVIGVIALVFIVRQAVRPMRMWITPTPQEIDRAEAFARDHARSAEALLVGGRDKAVWFWEPTPGAPKGLVLYQHRSDKLIVFKDPVVASGASPRDLVRAFLDHAATLDADVVFSMVSGEWMGHLHDFGFHFLKQGEEAVVNLMGFSLAGGRNANFRRTLREVEKAGITFRIDHPPFDAATIDGLRAVSDRWLAEKGGRELQFSACCFGPDYVNRNPIGAARDGSGRIVAFVNLLRTRPGGAATIDFMRYIPDVADGLMDYVLLSAMQAMSAEGYASFSLGSAALREVGAHRSSFLVERALRAVSSKAERVYNYKGLQAYKAKFHPEWVPRYLAYQRPWEWASSLIAATALIEARSRTDRRRIAAARIGARPPADAGSVTG